jgi:hypothetical protein
LYLHGRLHPGRWRGRWGRRWRARGSDVLGRDQEPGAEILSDRSRRRGFVSRSYDRDCRRCRRINPSANRVLELSELLAVRRQLIEQFVAKTLVLGVTQQTPELVLTLRERDQTGDIVADLLAR